MVFFFLAFGLLFHILFWGIGLACFIAPRRWLKFWPVFIAPAALALQSAVVWAGAYSPLKGANAYAWGTEVIPVVLLGLGGWRLGEKRRSQIGRDFGKFSAVWLCLGAALAALVMPFALASKTLTTSSLGSCDAADYAAGARVLQEFSRGDRPGFMGLTEVVQVASVDNFFDFWLRLNHFTPSALIAFNGAALRLQPYEITSVMTALLLVLSLPVVFWIARAGLRYGPGTSTFIMVVYAVSPLMWYAVFHVAMAQLLAGPAIALVTWSGLALWRGGASWRLGGEFAGVLATAYWLIWGSYNFIVIVCLVPSVAFAGGQALWSGEWRRFRRWSVLMVLPLIATALIFTQRALGLVERFQLFGQFDFGWKIPALSPEGWLGLVAQPSLAGFNPWLRWVLSVVVAGVWLLALVRDGKRRRVGVFVACCFTAPIILGYSFLLMRGILRGTNASYDAYKLFAVFYPSLLAGFCYWLTLLRGSAAALRVTALVFAIGVLATNGEAARQMARRMKAPPLLVEPSSPQLQRIESCTTVESVNIIVSDFWNRLWANSFLLRKPQYFLTHTYEGRRNTPLKGRWDLVNGIVTIRLPEKHSDVLRLNLPPDYSLLDTRSPYYLRVRLEDGWYESESLPLARMHWRWTKDHATMALENPQIWPLQINLGFDVRSLVERDLQIWMGGQLVGTVKVGMTRGRAQVPAITIPPGATTLDFRSSTQPVAAGPNDARLLGFAVYGIEVQVQSRDERIDP